MRDKRAGNLCQRQIIRRYNAPDACGDRMRNISTECSHVAKAANLLVFIGGKMSFRTVFQNTQTMLFCYSHDCIHLTRLSKCMHWNCRNCLIRDALLHFGGIHVIRDRIHIDKDRCQPCMNTGVRCGNKGNRRNKNFTAIFPPIQFLHGLQANMQGRCSAVTGNAILLIVKPRELFLKFMNHLSLRKSSCIQCLIDIALFSITDIRISYANLFHIRALLLKYNYAGRYPCSIRTSYSFSSS